MKRTIQAVLNRDGGTLKSEDIGALVAKLEQSFRAGGHAIECTVASGRDLRDTLGKAAGSDRCDTILAGGGDGTISLAAGLAWKNRKALAVLPAGTMNLFARSLGIPLTLDEAIEALARGQVLDCDIATINGHPFIHQVSWGFQARAVRLRDRMEFTSRYGKIFATLRSLGSVVFNPPDFEADVSLDGADATRQAFSALSVSNNIFGEGHMPYADRVDGGKLGFYTSQPVTPRQAMRLVADIMLGTWAGNEKVETASADRVDVSFLRPRRAGKAVADGELMDFGPKLEFRLHKKELKVLTPAGSVQGPPGDGPN